MVKNLKRKVKKLWNRSLTVKTLEQQLKALEKQDMANTRYFKRSNRLMGQEDDSRQTIWEVNGVCKRIFHCGGEQDEESVSVDDNFCLFTGDTSKEFEAQLAHAKRFNIIIYK